MHADAGQTGPFMHEVAERCLQILAQHGAPVLKRGPVDWERFAALSAKVHAHFVIPSTTFTPMMRRLLYCIAESIGAREIVGAGTYVGYTFAWLLRDADHASIAGAPFRAQGIDVNAEANAIARRNLAALRHGDQVVITDGDAIEVVAMSDDPIDLLYIDIDSPDAGKSGYTEILKAALPRLRPRALVLAHDACVARFRADFERFESFIRSEGRLTGPWVLPVDACGLAVAAVR